MAESKYHFYTYARKGMATQIEGVEEGAKRPKIPVAFDLNSNDEQVATLSRNKEGEIDNRIELYAPCDITGYDTEKMHARIEPKPNIGDFEPNYFPFIEYRGPDFLWRFTPEAPPSGKGLTPWLTLVVLKMAEGDNPSEFIPVKPINKGLPQAITVLAGTPLPDLKNVWQWAHVQAVTMEDHSNEAQAAARSDNRQTVNRLMCPRRLEPGVKYCAFVIPTYQQGVQRGLGNPIEGIATQLAWEGSTAPDGLTLPYYYKWEFRTGQRGDFEYLIRLLEPRAIPNLGTRRVDCGNPGYGLANTIDISENEVIEEDEAEIITNNLKFESALLSLDTEYSKWGSDKEGEEKGNFRKDLKDLLNSAGNHKKVLPPIYGRWHAFNKEPDKLLVKDEDNTNKVPWLYQLNTDPRHRFVAGLGAEIVKEQQEDFMAEAWTQVGNLKTFNRSVERTKFAQHLSAKAHLRFSKMNSSDLVQFHSPLASKIKDRSKQLSIKGALKESAIPNALIESTSRKLLRKNGAIRTAQYQAFKATNNGNFLTGKMLDRIEEKEIQVLSERTIPGGLLDHERQRAYVQTAAMIDIQKYSTLRVKTTVVGNQPLVYESKIRILENGKGYAIEKKVKRELLELPENDSNFTIKKFSGSFQSLPNITTNFQFFPTQEYRRIVLPEGSGLKNDEREFIFRNDEYLSIDFFEGKLGSISGKIVDEQGEDLRGVKVRLKQYNLTGTTDANGQFKITNVPIGFHELEFDQDDYTMYHYVNMDTDDALQIGKQYYAPGFAGKLGGMVDVANIDFDEGGLPENVPVDVKKISERILEKINPKSTIVAPISDKIMAIVNNDKFRNFKVKKKEELEPIMAHPEFMMPMYEYLRNKSQDYILTGLEDVPQNTIMLLKTNRRFIEAYMLGLNHEFASELLWRDYPTDMRGTYFQQFWEEVEEGLEAEEQKDIDEIFKWDEKLGYNEINGNNRSNFNSRNDDENTVLLIRGDILKKYPNTAIYILPAQAALVNGQPYPNFNALPMLPIFDGTLPPDITFLGFKINPTILRDNDPGYFVIFEERVTETRFGLDIAKPMGNFTLENDLSWDCFVGGDVPPPYPIDINAADIPDTEKSKWAERSAAKTAAFTYQKPVRVIVHASKMIPKRSSS